LKACFDLLLQIKAYFILTRQHQKRFQVSRPYIVAVLLGEQDRKTLMRQRRQSLPAARRDDAVEHLLLVALRCKAAHDTSS
jgi:hypothetical protein